MIFNDKMNNSFLDEKFETDPRAGVIASLTATNLTKWSYRQRLDALHDLQNCDSIPAKSVNLNALAAGKTPGKEKPPCHNFAKGTCTYGDKCRYSHAKPPLPTTATAPPPPPKYNQAPNNRNTVHTYISPRHRMIIGPSNPQGDPKNPLCLTRNQRVKLNALTADDTMDSWVDQSHYNHVPRDSNGNVFAGVLLTESSSSSATSSSSSSANVYDPNMHTPVRESYIDTFRTLEYIQDMTVADYNLHLLTPAYGRRQPDTDSDEKSIHSTSSSDDNEVYTALLTNHDTHMADQNTYTTAISSYVELVVSRFHRQNHHPDYDANTSLNNYLVYTNFHTNAAGIERTDLQIFGWSVSYPLQVYTIMPDFRIGSPALLDLIQNIGRSYLRAIYTAIPMTTLITGSSYMTFSPLSTVYNAPGTAGSYVSNVACVADFFYYYNHLTVLGTSRTYLILAIIYDFMAYCAQFFRRVLEHRPASNRQLAAARITLRRSITMILGTSPQTPEFKNLTKIMYCIIETIMPNPYLPLAVPDPSYASPTPSRKRKAQDPQSEQITKMDIPQSLLKQPRLVRTKRALPVAIAEVPVPVPQPPLDITSPTHHQPYVHVLQSPNPTGYDGESDHEIRNSELPYIGGYDNDEEADQSEMNYFSTVALNHMSSTSTKFIMDSGAGKCGTSDLSILKNIVPCQDITVTGAFGPSTAPPHTGKLGPLNLDAVHIEGMGKQTLISLSQFCAGGTTGVKYIGVFTPTEYRMYEMHSALPIPSTLAKTGKEAEHGSVQNGIHVRESS